MADDSWDIDVNMDFHPCDRPHGMKDYVLSDLTPEQQTKLNERKREQVRTDQQYLASHPEIRGIIIMILHILMKQRPNHNIFETIGRHFTKSSVDIQEQIIDYLKERGELLTAKSTILPSEELLSDTGFVYAKGEEQEEETEEEEHVSRREQEERAKKAKPHEELPLVEDLIVLKIEDLEELQRSSQKSLDVPTVSSAEKVCLEVLGDIIEAVIEEIDIPSLESIGSGSTFPIDYEDHAFGSAESVASFDVD